MHGLLQDYATIALSKKKSDACIIVEFSRNSSCYSEVETLRGGKVEQL